MAEYIDREAAIDAIMAVYVGTAGYKTRERVFAAKEAVHRLPAADAVPVVHGRWEETDLVEIDDHGGIYRIPNAGLRCPHCMVLLQKRFCGGSIIAPTAARRWMRRITDARNDLLRR